MTRIFDDGFESGDFSAWASALAGSGASIAVGSEGRRHGAFGARIVRPTGGTYQIISPTFAAVSEAWLRGYVCFPSLTYAFDAGDAHVLRFTRASNTLNFGVLANNPSPGVYELYLRYRAPGGIVNYAQGSGFPLEGDRWYHVELHGKVGASGFVELYVDGALALSVSAALDANAIERLQSTNLAGWQEMLLDSVAADTSRIEPVRGFRVYDNTGAGAVDYGTPQAVLDETLGAWTSSALSAPATWRFGVRAYNEYGEEKNLDVVSELALTGSGVVAPARPNRPSGLSARAVANGAVELSWSYDEGDEPAACSHFHVSADDGTGAIDYAEPIGSVARDDGDPLTHYAFATGSLADGVTRRFAVRAATAADVEDDGTESVACIPDASPPLQPASLSAAVVK